MAGLFTVRQEHRHCNHHRSLAKAHDLFVSRVAGPAAPSMPAAGKEGTDRSPDTHAFASSAVAAAAAAA